jgi:hypothetical protein
MLRHLMLYVRYDTEIHVCACLSKLKWQVRSDALSKNVQLACIIVGSSTGYSSDTKDEYNKVSIRLY